MGTRSDCQRSIYYWIRRCHRKGSGKNSTKSWQIGYTIQDAEVNKRYEVEVQLGVSDESHIIRTIEYWDIERKRYPQYEHTAVIIAEDITSRFLNVINLFNGMIPFIAIQMKAIRTGDNVGLIFTTIIDELSFGLVDEDEEVQEPTDRSYWESRGSKKTVAMADQLLEIAKTHDQNLELKYNKFYIGLARNNQPFNFIISKPKKNFIRIELRLKNSSEIQELVDASDLDVMDYDSRYGIYRIRLKPGEIERNKEVLESIIAKAYAENSRI